ncbi:ribonuclease R family protein [Synechococcus sp. PCC 7336]|uniref:ribonuclease R family protein n=1 Tax=Synechococcus sp. PCC 7336 TaxID=195250 RepID=UPI00047764F2|nr:ribonuclease R family protein [Synechococcus sp. PCC 7336]
MEFSVAQLFAQFQPIPDDATPPLLTRSDLDRALDIATPAQAEELDIALNALMRIGYIESKAGDATTYCLSNNDKLVEGQLRCSSKGFCFAIRNEPGGDDVYIHGSNLNGAWNGDRVLARVIKDGNRRRSPEGQVAAVIERVNPTVVAQLKQTEKGFKGVPLDDRLLFELDLTFPPPEPATEAAETSSSTHLPPEAEAGKFVYVEVERYPLAQIPPLGLVRKVLGSESGTSMDIDLVCCKHDLPQEFPESLETAAVKVKGKLTKTDLKKRQDCRNWYMLALSGDGEPAQMALSLDQKINSTWRLGIHITDVAHALLADHPVDLEAQERGLATHLEETTLPLFPSRVLQQCSFAAGTERPAISAIYNIAADGTIKSFEIRLTSVNCDTRLTYGQAQSLLEAADESSMSDAARLLKQLLALQPVLRQQRHEKGGWDVALSSSRITADEGNGSVLGLDPQQPLEVLASELQVLANHTIACHLKELGVPALFRTCAAPSPEAMLSFLRLAENMGLGLELADPETVTVADLQRFADRISAADIADQNCIPHLAQQLTATLPVSTEQAEPVLHAGLGLQPYCHATAPLVRYVDLMNQRLLHDVLTRGRDRRSSRVKTGVDIGSSTCHGQINWNVLTPKRQKEWADLVEYSVEHLNDRQALVREAETELAGLKRSGYMQKHIGETVSGLIVGVQNYGIFVLTDPVLAEGLVHVSSLKDDWYEYRNRQQALVGRKSRQQFQLGDRIEVEVKGVDYYRRQIDLGVVGGGKVYEEEEEQS